MIVLKNKRLYLTWHFKNNNQINFFPDDGGFGGQAAEDSDHRMRRSRQLDLLQGDDGGLHQVLRLGDVASHHQVLQDCIVIFQTSCLDYEFVATVYSAMSNFLQ
jgi:hypothetical protein